MADLADHAFAHATAVLGAGEAALTAAVAAVARGGRSRSAVLGHARAGVLERAAAVPAPDLAAPVPEDLAELAAVLAATRPAMEQVVVDLEGRHGLDRGGFARALGTSSATAAARAADVFATWQQALDPVLLARLGPAGCAGLAAALGVTLPAADPDETAGGGAADTAGATSSLSPTGVGPTTVTTVADLLALGPAVVDHAAGCEGCTDRLRSMVSVRTLVAQRPLPTAPTPVRAAAAPSRLRRPVPVPPLEPRTVGRRRRGRVAAAVTAVAVVAGGAAVLVAVRDRNEGEDPAVAALTRVPEEGSALVVTPASVAGPLPGPVRLENRSSVAVGWVAAPDEPWLRVAPATGRLAPGGSIRLRLALADDAPEGEVHGAVQVTGRDGSATVVRLATTVERPPDVAATADGCTVRAMVEDESEVATVQLHWLEPSATPAGRPTERIATMPEDRGGFVGSLPSLASPVTWWVSATDARGNDARTADDVVPGGSCG